jgi:Arc-like DNA binding domain
MKKSRKKRVGRPPGRKAPWRPVLSTRIPEELYEQIKTAARASARTLSQEAVWRLARSFAWEAALGDFETWKSKVRAENEDIARGNLEIVLRGRNWRKVRGVAFGAPNWISPDNHAISPDGFVDTAVEQEQQQKLAALDQHLEAMLDRVVTRAVTRALAEAQSTIAEKKEK